MNIKNLKDLFVFKIMALYDVESEIVKALPTVAAEVTDEELVTALTTHLEETKTHVKRLEQVFNMLDIKPKKMDSQGIRGMIKDTEAIIAQRPDAPALDAAITASARHIEHYEISEYLSAIAWADALGYEGAAELLRETLAEEENADSTLSELADSGVNERAMTADEEY